MMQNQNPQSIEHSGVKGMKWGVRKLSSPTAAKARSLSDEELRKNIARKQLEQQYINMNATRSEKFVNGGKQFMANQGKNILGGAITGIAVAALTAQGKQFLNRKYGVSFSFKG